MNLNKAFIVGRLTRDPEVKTTPNGHNVATFSLATNRFWNNQQGQRQEFTEYHNIVAWGKLADIAGQYLKKGGLLMIEGRLQTRNWEGQDGVKRYRTEIVAESMQMGPRAGAGSESASGQAPQPTEENIPTIQQDEPIASNDSDKKSAASDIDVENIPF
jgi:single-strand DNA-binding protein